MIRRIALAMLLPVLATGGGVALGAAAHASTSQVVSVLPSDDAYSSSARPTYHDGSVEKLVAGTLNGDAMATYLKFKVGTLASGTAVQKASVTLTRDEHHFPTAGVKLWQVPGTGWSENTLTYSNRPALGGALGTLYPTYTATTVTFDVSSVVRQAGTYAFAVTSPAGNDVVRFRSAEYATDRPVLKLTTATSVASPSPTTSPKTSPAPSTSPTTAPAPSTSPKTSVSPTPTGCTVTSKLVPTCNILWGAAAGGFSTTARDQALKDWEARSGRTASIFHTYHVGDELFPTSSEIAMASDATSPRLLLENWKVAAGTTWAAVAAGKQDARIDKEAAYIKANYPGPFYMVIHHEPENDVVQTAGSGMTAANYAAMYRHTVQRLRADGATNVVFVMAYMSYEKWFNESWWGQLYPGDDVVDWVGVDAYLTSGSSTFHNGPFSQLMDRTTSAAFPGFYKWATTNHPTKPVMLAEWGVYENTAGDYTVKPAHFNTVLPELASYPALKALVYFDAKSTQAGYDSSIDSSAGSLAAFKKIAADPRFVVRVR